MGGWQTTQMEVTMKPRGECIRAPRAIRDISVIKRILRRRVLQRIEGWGAFRIG